MQEKNVKNVTATVVSKMGSKSIKVAVDFRVMHPKYGKYMTRRSVLYVHDEHNQAGVGDVVEVVEGRPYSKTKSWRLVKVLQTAAKEE